MCQLYQGMISCQVSFYPLGCSNFISPIDNVLALIEDSGLNYTVGDMATVIKGPASQVLSLISQIMEKMTELGCSFSMPVTFSNTCGLE